jgi:hypothetical protein
MCPGSPNGTMTMVAKKAKMTEKEEPFLKKKNRS